MSHSQMTQTLAEKDPGNLSFDMGHLSEQEKQELIVAETASITSDTTADTHPENSKVTFKHSKSFHIHAEGVPVLRLPVPPKELVIVILNLDGSVAYQSTRERRSSGNSILSNPQGQQLIGTTYFFGPGRPPVLTRLDGAETGGNTINTASRWTSRAQTFTLPDSRTFTWSYKRERGFGGSDKKGNALVLTMDGQRLAVLLRNEETRTPGSNSCSAGNGGELILSEIVGGKGGIGEDLVIATCLLMLKKEIDRRRALQFAMIAGAGSS